MRSEIKEKSVYEKAELFYKKNNELLKYFYSQFPITTERRDTNRKKLAELLAELNQEIEVFPFFIFYFFVEVILFVEISSAITSRIANIFTNIPSNSRSPSQSNQLFLAFFSSHNLKSVFEIKYNKVCM